MTQSDLLQQMKAIAVDAMREAPTDSLVETLDTLHSLGSAIEVELCARRTTDLQARRARAGCNYKI